jgi:phage gpG-like protein
VDEIAKISKQVSDAIKSDRTIRIALSTTLAVQKQRIFAQGLKTNGSQIGQYSKKYGEYKRTLGRNPGYVNLRLTDAMMNDFQIIGSNMEYGFGFRNDFNAQKAGWAEDRYGEIFELSESEVDLFTNTLFFELSR